MYETVSLFVSFRIKSISGGMSYLTYSSSPNSQKSGSDSSIKRWFLLNLLPREFGNQTSKPASANLKAKLSLPWHNTSSLEPKRP